jgi:hypothetical protein
MQNKQVPSSTGGTITPIMENGVQVGIRHTAGKAYSGKIAAQESKLTKGK